MGKENFDFDSFEKEAIEGLKTGKEVFGKNGLFTSIIKKIFRKES